MQKKIDHLGRIGIPKKYYQNLVGKKERFG